MSETKTDVEKTSADVKEAKEKDANEVVTMRQLLECGVHFGHQTKRWNPKMKRYIFTSRNGIHVIDLQQTIKLIKRAYQIIREIAKANGSILLVGTKKQAQETIELEAKNCDMPFVNHRWLGGTLTNNVTIRQSINKLKKLNKMVEDGTIDQLSNKEASRITKKIAKLEYYLGGIKDMSAMPSALFIIDTNKEQLAIKEAKLLGIPIIAVVDTNSDPSDITYPIPANDDAIRAIRLLCSIVSKAVSDGSKEAQPTAKANGTDEAAQNKKVSKLVQQFDEDAVSEEEIEKLQVISDDDEKATEKTEKAEDVEKKEKDEKPKAKTTKAKAKKDEAKADADTKEDEKPAKKTVKKKAATKKETEKAADAEEKPKKATKAKKAAKEDK